MTLEPGSRLGPYEIVAPLGVGGMGVVYRAVDRRLDRQVAIKLISHDLADDPVALARFEREARALAALAHPNIVSIFEFDHHGDQAFVVTELLEGQPLGQIMKRAPLAWREATEIAVSVAEGVAAAHAKGIVHRDLKPHNIFRTDTGQVKILDFGIARSDSAPPIDPDDPTTPHTEPGTVLGTVGYIAPEQLRGEGAGASGDIFAIGCVLYEMVTGQRAFVRKTSFESIAAVLNDDLPPLAEELGVPVDLQAIVTRATAKDPSSRYQSALELAADLRSVLEGREHSKTHALHSRPAGSHRLLVIELVIVITIALAALAAVYYLRNSSQEGIDSIAVLPFSNSSNDPEIEYLSDGITESIINRLSRMPGVRVVARTTAFQYKSKSIDPSEVGKRLRVEAIVVGKVVSRGENVVIQADLVQVSDGTELWGERYNVRVSDILSVQEEIAREISRRVAPRLHSTEATGSHQTRNPAAYKAYLKGRFHWNKRTEEGYGLALLHFNEAISIDPSYALAYSGLADCYVLSYALPESETMSRAKAAARRAIGLDEELAEAHTSLGHALHYYDWDFAAADRQFQRAIELNPGYATAHHWYGRHLVQSGREEEGMREMRRAADLDPLSMIISNDLGYCFYLSRDYDRAIAQYRKSLEMSADFVRSHIYIGWAYARKGDYDSALRAAQEARQRAGSTSEILALLGYVYSMSGEKESADETARELAGRAAREYVAPLFMMQLHVGRREPDKLLQLIRQASKDGEKSSLLDLHVDPIFDPYRNDPRMKPYLPKL